MDAALIAKAPGSVWFGTTEFALRFVPPDHAALKEDAELNGCVEFEPPEVFIADSLSTAKTIEIICHEFTHIHNDDHCIDDGTDEEDISAGHGKGWGAFWINNPRFQRWWLTVCVAARKERESGTMKPKEGKQ